MKDEYEDKEIDDPYQLQRIMNLYKSLHSQVFVSEDNYIFNSDLVDEYLNLLVSNDRFNEAIEARQQFIAYLKKDNSVDH